MYEVRSLALAFAFIGACSGVRSAEPPPSPPRAEEPAEREPVAEAVENPLPAHPEPDPESACGRALACCREYATAVPDVVEASACAGVFEAVELDTADARCDAMKTGWREALAYLEDEPPEACR